MKKLFFISIILLFSGCYILYAPSPPLLEAFPYTSGKVKIDGYYYSIWSSKDTNINNIYSYVTIIIPYSPGYYIDYGSMRFDYKVDSINNNIANEIKDGLAQLSRYKSLRNMWGVYSLKTDSITLKKLSGRWNESLTTYTGLVLNDTTFMIRQKKVTGSSSKDENGVFDLLQTYMFQKLNPKPDSTNQWIRIKE